MKSFKLFSFFIYILLSGCYSENKMIVKTEAEQVAYDLMARILPGHKDQIQFQEISRLSDSTDLFRITTDGKIVTIAGNNAGSMAVGLNHYLKNQCNSQISLNYQQLNLPDNLPLPSKPVAVQTPFDYRYFFNFCTYGYTMPWWNWERWEKMIDYMAMKGVNMPLATIGQEAVWQEVYQEFGLTGKELEDFFVGPAHLPWGRMGNIDGMAGPLPQSWISQRKELQKKILARMRSFGMKPVLSAFTGHVPKSLQRIYPTAKIYQISDWAGVKGTYFLDPTDTLFMKIGKAFIEKQTAMYGTDHLYDADCFIEVDPPSGDPDFLGQLGDRVYKSMEAADPQATWILQGWFFFFKKDFWTMERGRAFLNGIPENKVIVLDLYGEKNPTWDKTDAFFGQPWIWNVICNEDQKVNMSGDLTAMQDQFQRAYHSEKDHNLKGIGVIPEGLGYNAIVQDFIFEKAWNTDPVDTEAWVRNYARRRYNSNNAHAVKAWELLLKTVYGRTRTFWSPLLTTPKLPVSKKGREGVINDDSNNWDFEISTFRDAAAELLTAGKEIGKVPGYEFDLVNVYREFILSLSNKFLEELADSFRNKDHVKFAKDAEKLLKLLEDLDRITGSNEQFLLGKWISEARNWGTTEAEKAYYENNARTIVTIWQPYPEGALRDYAGKQWNGLFKGYYKPRWELFIQYLQVALGENKDFDEVGFDKAVRQLDYQWTLSSDHYSDTPVGNPLEIAAELLNSYSSYVE